VTKNSSSLSRSRICDAPEPLIWSPFGESFRSSTSYSPLVFVVSLSHHHPSYPLSPSLVSSISSFYDFALLSPQQTPTKHSDRAFPKRTVHDVTHITLLGTPFTNLSFLFSVLGSLSRVVLSLRDIMIFTTVYVWKSLYIILVYYSPSFLLKKKKKKKKNRKGVF